MAMEVAAAKATVEPREGKARQKDRKAASQTVRIGERKRSSTLWKKCGYMRVRFGMIRMELRGISKHFREMETYNSAVSGKGKHHPRVRGHGEQSAMPDADHDQTHQNYSSIVPEDVNKDLQDWLSDRTRDGVIEVLDTKEERHQYEKSE